MMDTHYLLPGKGIVKILRRWNGRGPRNVAIELPNGDCVIRPFRGLRKIRKADLDPQAPSPKEMR